MIGDDTLGEWLLDRPLRIALTLVVALLATIVFRFLMHRVSSRIVTKRAQSALDRVSRGTGGSIAVPDPGRFEARADTLGAVLANMGTAFIWVITVMLVLGELGVEPRPAHRRGGHRRCGAGVRRTADGAGLPGRHLRAQRGPVRHR